MAFRLKGGKTEVRDRGYAAFLKEMKRSSGRPHVKVGVLQGKEHQGSEGLTVAQVAAANEFGTETQPERSFIRSTVMENREKYIKQTKEIYLKVIAQKMTVRLGLKLIGEVMQADIQNKIASHPPPPNSAATIKRKGSSGTLIDTGQLRQSIRYDVKENGET